MLKPFGLFFFDRICDFVVFKLTMALQAGLEATKHVFFFTRAQLYLSNIPNATPLEVSHNVHEAAKNAEVKKDFMGQHMC